VTVGLNVEVAVRYTPSAVPAVAVDGTETTRDTIVVSLPRNETVDVATPAEFSILAGHPPTV
jgi:hypothetical protein